VPDQVLFLSAGDRCFLPAGCAGRELFGDAAWMRQAPAQTAGSRPSKLITEEAIPMMNRTKTMVAAGGVALALAGTGAGVAVAQTSTPAPAPKNGSAPNSAAPRCSVILATAFGHFAP